VRRFSYLFTLTAWYAISSPGLALAVSDQAFFVGTAFSFRDMLEWHESAPCFLAIFSSVFYVKSRIGVVQSMGRRNLQLFLSGAGSGLPANHLAPVGTRSTVADDGW
jgi:hypothetical protein